MSENVSSAPAELISLKARLGSAFRADRRARPSLPTALTALATAAPWVLFAAVFLVPVGGFLVVAVSPRLFGQGEAWFTLASFHTVLTGWNLHAVLDTLLIGVSAGALAVAVATWLSWLLERTTVGGRGLWRMLLWVLLLAPSYLEALGWTWLVEQGGVLARLTGHDPGTLRTMVLGPAGVTWVLATRGVPYAVLAISALLRGMGREFEDAARTHGAGRLATARAVLPILAPALWAGFAIVFAESISDFGVAATLGAQAHFPLATYAMYQAIGTFPAQFGLAAALGWLLMGLVALALFAQRRATRRRGYAVLSGRTRPIQRTVLDRRRHALVLTATTGLFTLAVGVPLLGAVLASFLPSSGPPTVSSFTLANYRHVLHNGDLLGPLLYSARLAVAVACAATVFGLIAGQALSRKGGHWSSRLLDLLLLTAIALPSVLLASGYIFTYNLPIAGSLGLDLYGTTTLLVLGYLAGALPAAARLLSGSIGQINDNLLAAARVHGAAPARAWLQGVLPLVAGPLLWVWLVSFATTVLEFPISQMLAPPDGRPLGVAITKRLEGYDFGGGGAMSVLAMVATLSVIGIALAATRRLLPAARGLEGQR
jgi:iron(III) transport system permease protein